MFDNSDKKKSTSEVTQHLIEEVLETFRGADVRGKLWHYSQKNQNELKQYAVNDANFSVYLSGIKFDHHHFFEHINIYPEVVFTGNLAQAAGGISFTTSMVHVRLMEVDVPELDSWPAEVRPVIIRQRAEAGHLLLPVWSGFFSLGHDELADVAMLAIGEAAGDHWHSSLNGRTGPEGAALLERLIAELERDPASYLKFVPVQQSYEYGNFLSRLRQMVQAVVKCAEKALWWEVK